MSENDACVGPMSLPS